MYVDVSINGREMEKILNGFAESRVSGMNCVIRSCIRQTWGLQHEIRHIIFRSYSNWSFKLIHSCGEQYANGVILVLSAKCLRPIMIMLAPVFHL